MNCVLVLNCVKKLLNIDPPAILVTTCVGIRCFFAKSRNLINNPSSSSPRVLKESERVYHLLDTVGTKPNVFYHVKVRNTD